jgi:hypothetical protein
VFKITCPPSVNATGLAATLPSWAIEKQDKLVHPYLIRHGIFVVTHHRDKRWQHPKTNKQMSFSSAHGVARRNHEKASEKSGRPDLGSVRWDQCVGE